MIKVGVVTPTAAINPVTVADQGGLDMLAQTGEYLTLSTQTLTLQPVLATSWSANSTGTVWTFKIRKGVRFSNGAPLTADDVVYTYKLHTNPAKGSNALSAFGDAIVEAAEESGNSHLHTVGADDRRKHDGWRESHGKRRHSVDGLVAD